ncbi:hypothetical protein RD792_000274 [Penstemon davidsonii]|uniref:Polygalacturonase n=1 Tax=Penstemon davidsonii TaxID=160366 RepID=A0ABR0DUR6_9LAMI|nr:hypothetical protein RD792_000274 [Penstemon davidsonii]
MVTHMFVAEILLFLPLLAFIVNAQEPAILDITKYGAKSDADISEALSNAWKEACLSNTSSRIVIPPGTWSLSQVKLIGPNKSPIELQVQGTLKAPIGQLPNKDGEWITINYVNYLEISGGGVFDGQGTEAWKRNDCHKNKNCAKLPLNLSFNFINNTYIHDVTTKDSKNFHVNCISSHNVKFQRFTISAPDESPNTDGIHLGRDSNITVIDSIIQTGDDCVSIGDESTEIHVENVTCGPGHGISVGSLGSNVAEKDVIGIYVKNCTFLSTVNGVRVKTWPSAPARLEVKNLHFEDIIMDNVSYPIIIDQEYCPHNLCNLKDPSYVKISNIFIKNIRGTSHYPEAVTLVCSRTNPCVNVQISDVDLTYSGNLGPTTTKCANVNPTLSGKLNPPICAKISGAQSS